MKIEQAVTYLVQNPTTKKLEGTMEIEECGIFNVSIYKVGDNLVRVDIKKK